jgi:hypothetical protein
VRQRAPGGALARVQRLEILAEHEYLAAHFEVACVGGLRQT